MIKEKKQDIVDREIERFKKVIKWKRRKKDNSIRGFLFGLYVSAIVSDMVFYFIYNTSPLTNIGWISCGVLALLYEWIPKREKYWVKIK